MRWLSRCAVLLLVAVAAGCGSDASLSALHANGEPLPAGERPTNADCETRLRADEIAAARIRAELHVDHISPDPQVIRFAAADSSANTTALGIPLTPPEEQELDGSGIAIDETSPISFWVNVGAPERFGGIWLDPPGTAHLVVSIVGGGADSLALARCLERRETSYVWAVMSLAAGEALKDRIGNDIAALRTLGIEVNSVDFDETHGIVVVGVTKVMPGMQEIFIQRYGGPIYLTQEGPAQPL